MTDSYEIEPELLPTFLAVLEQGRIAAAARALNVSQPAVSARIRRLEESLGTALFERSVRGVAPTPAGVRLAHHAREIQRVLREATTELASTGELGPLSIAASTTIAAYVLPYTVAAYRMRYPSVEFELHVGNTEEVIELVRTQRVPLGIVEGHRRAQAVRLKPWIEDELQLVVGTEAPNHWKTQKALELDAVPILWREVGSGTRAVMARALHRAGARNKPRRSDFVLGSNEAILSSVAAGLGVGFLSRWMLGPHIASGRLRPIAGFEPKIRRTFHWATPSGGLAGAEAHFVAFAEANPPVLR